MGKAGKGLRGAAKGAESAAEDAGKVVVVLCQDLVQVKMRNFSRHHQNV